VFAGEADASYTVVRVYIVVPLERVMDPTISYESTWCTIKYPVVEVSFSARHVF
jgi:hypothetical protein